MIPELERRRRVRRRVRRLILVANLGGMTMMDFYTTIEGARAEWGLFLLMVAHPVNFALSAIIVLGLLAVAIGFMIRLTKPLWDWYLDPQADPHPPEQVRRLALDLPTRSARFSFWLWILLSSAVVLVIWPLFWRDVMPLDGIYRSHINLTLALMGLGAPITAVLIYLAVEHTWSPEIPLFFRDDTHPGDIAATRVSLRRKLTYAVLLGLAPMVLLAVEAYNQAVHIAGGQPSPLLTRLFYKEIYLVAVWAVVMLVLAGTMGRSIVGAVERLRREMQAVRDGDIDVHIPVSSNDEFGDLAVGFNAMVDGLHREKIIRKLFGRYVTPEVAEHAIMHGAELGGQLTEVTVLFSDIRGFTALTETLPPDAILGLLNRYFDAMADAIAPYGGLINEFSGDSILVLYGTPINPADDHPLRAVRAAQAMLAALADFNVESAEHGEPALRIGIGVATGPVVAGHLGSRDRLEYTVIGDTVNLASRLESLTKSLGSPLLLNAEAAQFVAESMPVCALGQAEVRGKQEPVAVFGVGAFERSNV